jgi:hypothetical protein
MADAIYFQGFEMGYFYVRFDAVLFGGKELNFKIPPIQDGGCLIHASAMSSYDVTVMRLYLNMYRF